MQRKVLFETMDGLGDVLMMTPALKVWAQKGFLVDVSCRFPAAFQNLSYVNQVFLYGQSIKNLSQYTHYYNLSFRLSNYHQKYCQQHRLLATAFLCDVREDELPFKRPEIILSEDEKKWATLVLPETEKKIALVLTSVDPSREYDRTKRQELISALKKQFPDFLVVLVGDKARDGDWQIKQDCPWKKITYTDCIDARGRTSMREMFAVIDRCEYCVTVDTAALHVAAAFQKPTVLLPSLVKGEWRIYEGMQMVAPPVSCYPCNQGTEDCKNKVQAGWCLGQISSDKICEALKILVEVKGV